MSKQLQALIAAACICVIALTGAIAWNGHKQESAKREIAQQTRKIEDSARVASCKRTVAKYDAGEDVYVIGIAKEDIPQYVDICRTLIAIEASK